MAKISIKADSTLFGIVISNLIENALNYSEDEVFVELTQNELKVIDTRIGISPKDLENITNKFYTKSGNNSLGLGLFIVNNVIKLHNF